MTIASPVDPELEGLVAFLVDALVAKAISDQVKATAERTAKTAPDASGQAEAV
jgi:hypothetical protein